MPGQEFNIKKGDTSPAIQATLEGADDLSGGSVQFRMASSTTATPVVDAAATITDAAAGEVQYEWTSGDTAEAGRFLAEFVVTYSNGETETFPNAGYITVSVNDDLE